MADDTPMTRSARPSYARRVHCLRGAQVVALILLGAATMLSACAPTGGQADGAGGSGASGSGGVINTSGGSANIGGAALGGSAVGGQASGVGGSFLGGGDGAGGGAATGGSSSDGGAAQGAGGSPAGGAGSTDIVDVSQMVEELGIGTNIGNTLENTTSWETGWGQPLITERFLQGLASRGIRTVRVPVAWDTYATNGVVDSTKAARVKEVVGWIEAAGMYSIVNIHWDGGWIFAEDTPDQYTLTEATKAKFTSYWQQISKLFENVGHRLIFEGLNEEANFWIDGNSSGQPDYAALNSLNQLFVTTVRAEAAYNKTRALLIAGFTTDIEKTCVDAFQVPSDPAGPNRLFLSLHYYTPYTFCGLDTVESWGSPATTWGTEAEVAELNRLFDKAAAFAMSRKTPVILGEFGVTPGVNFPREPASRVRWMQEVLQASLARNMAPVLWDTGSEISREDGAFSVEFEQVMASLPRQ